MILSWVIERKEKAARFYSPSTSCWFFIGLSRREIREGVSVSQLISWLLGEAGSALYARINYFFGGRLI